MNIAKFNNAIREVKIAHLGRNEQFLDTKSLIINTNLRNFIFPGSEQFSGLCG